MADNFPSADFGASQNEVLLYIDQALAVNLIGQVYNGAKLEGNIAVPEAYMTTFALPALTQDTITKKWYTTLPQPPISLPLGYSIDDAYFANSVDGQGTPIFLIKHKRKAYRDYMPTPFGVQGFVEGSKITFKASDGGSLLDQTVFVSMASTRTSSITDVMNLPDDAIEGIFMNVVAKLKDRMQIPKDVVLDDISAGNKGS